MRNYKSDSLNQLSLTMKRWQKAQTTMCPQQFARGHSWQNTKMNIECALIRKVQVLHFHFSLSNKEQYSIGIWYNQYSSQVECDGISSWKLWFDKRIWKHDSSKNCPKKEVKQVQSMWVCIKPFKNTFKSPQWQKVKEMQPVQLCILLCI